VHGRDFKPDYVPLQAAACVLLALAATNACSQDAPAPETHGIVIANMDRSVRPGGDFNRYANGMTSTPLTNGDQFRCKFRENSVVHATMKPDPPRSWSRWLACDWSAHEEAPVAMTS
jgi:hypothetical protein